MTDEAEWDRVMLQLKENKNKSRPTLSAWTSEATWEQGPTTLIVCILLIRLIWYFTHFLEFNWSWYFYQLWTKGHAPPPKEWHKMGVFFLNPLRCVCGCVYAQMIIVSISWNHEVLLSQLYLNLAAFLFWIFLVIMKF